MAGDIIWPTATAVGPEFIPHPLPPPSAGEGEQKGVGAIFPRALALSHITPPLTGLATMHLGSSNLMSELMRQDVRSIIKPEHSELSLLPISQPIANSSTA